jgi:hypothetical protein
MSFYGIGGTFERPLKLYSILRGTLLKIFRIRNQPEIREGFGESECSSGSAALLRRSESLDPEQPWGVLG